MRSNQRKEDYLNSLNWLKEKAIFSNFTLDMTNDMIAITSNWEERLRPPKCDKKDDPQVWATSFLHQLTRTEKEKTIKLHVPCFEQDTKANQKCLKAL